MSGEEFKAWRKDQFLSQAKIADLLGVHINTITVNGVGPVRASHVRPSWLWKPSAASAPSWSAKPRERREKIAHPQHESGSSRTSRFAAEASRPSRGRQARSHAGPHGTRAYGYQRKS
jgi:hypothetical protein